MFMDKKTVLNSKGEPVELNAREKLLANNIQRQIKNVGYEVDVTTLTAISKSVIEQKFFEVAPADYMPVQVGEGAWAADLTSYLSYSLGDEFDTGILNSASNNGRMASADTQVDSVTVKIANWAKSISWSLFDLQQASRSGNWDLVTSKELSRKKNWDLGIQRVAFLGMTSDATNYPGLLSQSDVTTDTSILSASYISSMTSANFAQMCQQIYEAYRNNAVRTSKPTHFIIPEADYNGLAAPYDPSFPIKTKLQALQEMFEMLTMNKDFKILPLAYANLAIQGTKNIYTLLNYDPESVRINIPIQYTNTLANSIDNFNFQNVGYGQFSGTKAYRPLEMIYFSSTATS